MTRKQAILALLVAPGGTAMTDPQKPDTTTDSTITATTPRTWSLAVTLEDGNRRDDDSPFSIRGYSSIYVTYRGQIRTISAKEIWEALA